MKYAIALAFLLAASSVAVSQKPKTDKFLPPAESHGKTLSGCGCDKIRIANGNSSSKSVSYWTLTVWAQYGKERKKYWEKTYGNFEVPIKHSVNSSGESAATGGAIGGYDTESYDFTPMDKACTEWSEKVKSAVKIEPSEGGKPKE